MDVLESCEELCRSVQTWSLYYPVPSADVTTSNWRDPLEGPPWDSLEASSVPQQASLLVSLGGKQSQATLAPRVHSANTA